MKTLSFTVIMVLGLALATITLSVQPKPQVQVIELEPLSFDAKKYMSIKAHIKALAPLKEENLTRIATSIYEASEAHSVEPKFIIAILMAESTFNQNAVSSTGDISIAQINYKVWGPESKRLGFPLNKQKLKTDSDYAIHAMARILSHLQTKYQSKDSIWFALYHSKTCRPDFCPKGDYAQKVSSHMAKWPSATSLNLILASN